MGRSAGRGRRRFRRPVDGTRPTRQLERPFGTPLGRTSQSGRPPSRSSFRGRPARAGGGIHASCKTAPTAGCPLGDVLRAGGPTPVAERMAGGRSAEGSAIVPPAGGRDTPHAPRGRGRRDSSARAAPSSRARPRSSCFFGGGSPRGCASAMHANGGAVPRGSLEGRADRGPCAYGLLSHEDRPGSMRSALGTRAGGPEPTPVAGRMAWGRARGGGARCATAPERVKVGDRCAGR